MPPTSPASSLAVKLSSTNWAFRRPTLDSLRTTSFNDHFALADTTWRMRFLLPDNLTEELIVASSYLVYIAADAIKTFTYIPHRDIMEVLRDRGILTSTGTEQSSA